MSSFPLDSNGLLFNVGELYLAIHFHYFSTNSNVFKQFSGFLKGHTMKSASKTRLKGGFTLGDDFCALLKKNGLKKLPPEGRFTKGLPVSSNHLFYVYNGYKRIVSGGILCQQVFGQEVV